MASIDRLKQRSISFHSLPGVGGYNFLSNQFFASPVPLAFQSWHISDLEMLAHISAFRLWSDDWAGLAITGKTNNEPTKKLLKSGRSRINRRLVMARILSVGQHRRNFHWDPNRITTSDNFLADSLSKWPDQKHQNLFWVRAGKMGASPSHSTVTDECFS